METGTGKKRLTGPMIVACHWNILSPVGPAEQEDGGSRPRSINSCRKKNVSSMSGRAEISLRGNRKCRDGAVAPPAGRFKGGNNTAREKTNLVDALESHWDNDMLKTVV
jgi:hypothetical protein